MQYREIEVTVLSAQDLKNVNFLGGAMNPYAEVWIHSSKKEQTGVCSGGGRNPSWDCALKLACEDRLFTSGGEISVAVYSRGSFSSNTLVGTVTVPLSDLIALLNAADESQSSTSTAMSCQVQILINSALFYHLCL
jgi:Ca2+-dependent lipid-binding protein